MAERALDKTSKKAAGAATKVTGNKNGQLALAVSGIGMIVAGVLVAVFFNNFFIVGISIAIAGVIGLGTLHPKVQSWIDEKANIPSAEQAPAISGRFRALGCPDISRKASVVFEGNGVGGDVHFRLVFGKVDIAGVSANRGSQVDTARVARAEVLLVDRAAAARTVEDHDNDSDWFAPK